MKKTLFAAMLPLLLVLAHPSRCQDVDSVMRRALQDQLTTHTVVYKTIDTTTLHLTIYDPPARSASQAAIVFFFGGGWVDGSPAQFERHARYFAERGLVAVLVEYRVASRNATTPFDAVMDARSAIRYLRAHAEILHIDPKKIIASGGSAGGQLAAAADLTHLDQPGEDTLVNARPNALVLFNPVIDNGPSGYGYDRIGARYSEISPLHNIRSGAAPAILFFGTRDKFVPVATARLYQQKMQEMGNRCELMLYEGQGHGFFNYRADNPNTYFYATLKEADAFLVSLGYMPPLSK